VATLVMHKFHCVEETDEVGSDSPYFLIFHGKASNPGACGVVKIRRESWDGEIDSGDTRVPNAVVASGIDTGSVVLVAMIEEDDGCDIGTVELTLVRSWMKAVFPAFAASNTLTPAKLGLKVAPEFAKAIDVALGNDDLLDIDRLLITKLSGQLTALQLTGDGGHYMAVFDMQ
jgi:hypothetical protein